MFYEYPSSVDIKFMSFKMFAKLEDFLISVNWFDSQHFISRATMRSKLLFLNVVSINSHPQKSLAAKSLFLNWEFLKLLSLNSALVRLEFTIWQFSNLQFQNWHFRKLKWLKLQSLKSQDPKTFPSKSNSSNLHFTKIIPARAFHSIYWSKSISFVKVWSRILKRLSPSKFSILFYFPFHSLFIII